ncbi:hypothetical protein HY637_01205 [Candidatus Woesearchaeota archaeon]|nr:hypothetical protein [Candidatus Woesearchaeota archaeon]
MAKTYSELEAWAIFIGALIIGVVLTSVFWAYITIPENVRQIEKEIENASYQNFSETVIIPKDFVVFCEEIDGTANWDNTGFRQCVMEDTSEKSLIAMKLLCKKFSLNLSYGSFGVKCEGKK